MKDYKQQIIDRGYKVVAETEDGISFVNEKVQTCAMLLFKYNQLTNLDKDRGHDLHKTLIDMYSYANKGTICVIVDYEGDVTEIETNEYYFLKIFTNKIHILPSNIDKTITVRFEPMTGADDLGDYTINPFLPVDGIACACFYGFLASVKQNCVVKYPKCIENNYFRYITNKFFTVENIV